MITSTMLKHFLKNFNKKEFWLNKIEAIHNKHQEAYSSANEMLLVGFYFKCMELARSYEKPEEVFNNLKQYKHLRVVK